MLRESLLCYLLVPSVTEKYSIANQKTYNRSRK